MAQMKGYGSGLSSQAVALMGQHQAASAHEAKQAIVWLTHINGSFTRDNREWLEAIGLGY